MLWQNETLSNGTKAWGGYGRDLARLQDNSVDIVRYNALRLDVIEAPQLVKLL